MTKEQQNKVKAEFANLVRESLKKGGMVGEYSKMQRETGIVFWLYLQEKEAKTKTQETETNTTKLYDLLTKKMKDWTPTEQLFLKGLKFEYNLHEESQESLDGFIMSITPKQWYIYDHITKTFGSSLETAFNYYGKNLDPKTKRPKLFIHTPSNFFVVSGVKDDKKIYWLDIHNQTAKFEVMEEFKNKINLIFENVSPPTGTTWSQEALAYIKECQEAKIARVTLEEPKDELDPKTGRVKDPQAFIFEKELYKSLKAR